MQVYLRNSILFLICLQTQLNAESDKIHKIDCGGRRVYFYQDDKSNWHGCLDEGRFTRTSSNSESKIFYTYPLRETEQGFSTVLEVWEPQRNGKLKLEISTKLPVETVTQHCFNESNNTLVVAQKMVHPGIHSNYKIFQIHNLSSTAQLVAKPLESLN